MTRRVPAGLFFFLVLGGCLVVGGLSLAQGFSAIDFADVLRALGAAAGLCEAPPPDVSTTVVSIRLPRVLIGLFGGGALAIAGTVMQALFRNPLASPEIIGTAQGSALGATVAIALGWQAESVFAVPGTAVVGALLVTGFVYGIAGGSRGFSISSLLLAGIAMNTLIGALIAFAISRLSYDDWGQGSQILFWLMGDFDRVTGAQAWAVGGGCLVLVLVLQPFLRDLDLLTLRDTGASVLGVHVVWVRSVLIAIASVLTAVVVAFTGGIAFVGLVVPHMARLVVGPAHRGLVPCAAILGSFMLLISDYTCRVLAPSSGLRLGVVMSMIGAPFFLFLLLRMRRGRAL